MSITNTIGGMLEKVAPVMANYYSFDDSLAAALKPSKSARVSRKLYEVPIKKYPGGLRKKFSADGGSLGAGTGPVYDYMKAGFIDSTINTKITQEQIDLTETSEQSRVNVLNDILKDAMDVLSNHDNVDLFGDGTGTLTNSSSDCPAANQLTFAATTDGIGVNRLLLGMAVDAWDSTLATLRSGGPFTVTAIDYENQIVTLSGSPGSLTSGDYLVVADVDAYGPSAPLSFSSTWPGDALTNAAGLTGDSWRHGLEYCNDVDNAYYLTKAKASFPQLKPQHIPANGAVFTFDHVERLKNLLIQARGKQAVSQLEGTMHQDRLLDLKRANLAVSYSLIEGTTKMNDLMPAGNYDETYKISGITTHISRCADRARFDCFIKGNWTRVEGAPTRFHKNPDSGSYIFEGRSSDAVAAHWTMFLKQKLDWCCEDPGASAYVDDLKISVS